MPVKTAPGSKSGGQINATGIDLSAKPTSKCSRNIEYSQIVCSDAIRAKRSDCFLPLSVANFFRPNNTGHDIKQYIIPEMSI